MKISHKLLQQVILYFVARVVNVPVAVAGLSAGIAGIGAVLSHEVDYRISYATTFIAIILLLVIVLKKILHPKVVWQELKHPVLGSFLPTFDMALMVVATVIAPYSPVFGMVLWYVAVMLHLIFMAAFLYYRLRDFNINHMLPSWFVPPIGVVVACLTGAVIHQPEVTHVIFYFGFSAYCLLLPIMIYRLIFGDKISDNQLPAFAVMGAPASLCLAGYLTAFNNYNIHIINFLLPIALMMTSVVYISIFRINPLRIKFIPVYAAFTFPLAVGANAILKYAKYLGTSDEMWLVWHSIGLFEMWFATIVIFWVLLNMVGVLWKIFKI